MRTLSSGTCLYICFFFIFLIAFQPVLSDVSAVSSETRKIDESTGLTKAESQFKNPTGDIQALWKKTAEHVALALAECRGKKEYSIRIDILDDPAEKMDVKTLDKIRTVPVKPGYTKEAGQVNIRVEHSFKDLKSYLDSKHAPGIFTLLMDTNEPVQFHYGLWKDTRAYLYLQGVRSVVKISRLTPFPRTVFFLGYSKTGALFGGASNVFGKHRFDHLLLQARFAFHNKKRVVRVCHRPVNTWRPWYKDEFKRILDQAVEVNGGPFDSAVIGYRGSVMNGLISRKKAEIVLRTLACSKEYSSRPFEKIASLFSAIKETLPFENPFSEDLEELVSDSKSLSKLEFPQPNPARIYQNMDILDKIVLTGMKILEKWKAMEPELLGSVKKSDEDIYEAVKVISNMLKDMKKLADLSVPVEKTFTEGPDHDLLPYLTGYYIDSSQRVKSLILFRNIYGDASRFFSDLISSGTVTGKTVLYSSCGAVKSGAKVGDILLPAGIYSDRINKTAAYDNSVLQNHFKSGSPKKSRLLSNIVSRSVFSPLVETMKFIRTSADMNISAIDCELESFYLGWNDHERPFGTIFIASDVPGSENTLSESESVSESRDAIFQAQRECVSAICSYFDIASMLTAGEKGYPRKRQGFFFGTYDPVHAGHLATALKAVSAAELSNIVMIPNYVSGHKPGASGFIHRHAMLKKALHTEPLIKTLPNEMIKKGFKKNGVTQMILDIKDYFKKENNLTDFYQVMGLDSFEKLLKYKVADHVCRAHIVLAVQRKGYELSIPGREFLLTHRGRCILVSDQGIPKASSSAIRRAVKKGKKPSNLKPSVYKYVLENNLYK